MMCGARAIVELLECCLAEGELQNRRDLEILVDQEANRMEREVALRGGNTDQRR